MKQLALFFWCVMGGGFALNFAASAYRALINQKIDTFLADATCLIVTISAILFVLYKIG